MTTETTKPRTLEEIAGDVVDPTWGLDLEELEHIRTCVREAYALGLAAGRAAPEEGRAPLVCTGSGTLAVDFRLVSDMSAAKRCGICGHDVGTYDGQHVITHPWRSPPPAPDAESAPEEENANDRYERLAAEFHRATGFMAPGKDVRWPHTGGGTYEERRAAWEAWLTKRAEGERHG